MKISSCPRTFSCPTYSASEPGRSERSICSSCGEEGLAEISRSVSTPIARNYPRCARRLRAAVTRLGYLQRLKGCRVPGELSVGGERLAQRRRYALGGHMVAREDARHVVLRDAPER